MNILFRDTMTVYNFHRDKTTGAEKWHRTVVKGIQWRHNRNELSVSNNVQSIAKAEHITIDFGHSYGNTAHYIQPCEYKSVPEEEIAKYWTLDTSEGMDVLVLGESEYEINVDCKLSELSKYFQYTVTVTAVSDNRNMPRLKHIKVVGK